MCRDGNPRDGGLQLKYNTILGGQLNNRGGVNNCVNGQDSSDAQIATLDTITQFDDTVGNFDSAEGVFDLGGTDTTSNPTYYASNIESSGTYIGANTITLDAIYDATFQATIDMVTNDLYDLFDSGRGALFFDEAKAPFDGTEQIHAFHRVQIATSTTSLANCTNFVDITQSATFKFNT